MLLSYTNTNANASPKILVVFVSFYYFLCGSFMHAMRFFFLISMYVFGFDHQLTNEFQFLAHTSKYFKQATNERKKREENTRKILKGEDKMKKDREKD